MLCVETTVETVETTEAARLECCVTVETVETTEAARLECLCVETTVD